MQERFKRLELQQIETVSQSYYLFRNHKNKQELLSLPGIYSRSLILGRPYFNDRFHRERFTKISSNFLCKLFFSESATVRNAFAGCLSQFNVVDLSLNLSADHPQRQQRDEEISRTLDEISRRPADSRSKIERSWGCPGSVVRQSDTARDHWPLITWLNDHGGLTTYYEQVPVPLFASRVAARRDPFRLRPGRPGGGCPAGHTDQLLTGRDDDWVLLTDIDTTGSGWDGAIRYSKYSI